MRKADEVLRAYIPILSSREAEDYFSLFSSWASILGDDMSDIAAHSEPVDVKNGALIVYVDHPGWMQKLMFRKKEVLSRLKQQYPELGIRNLFIQKVRDDEFVRRREARISGEKLPSTDAGKSTTENVPEESLSPRYSVSEPDGELAETVKRIKRMIGDDK